MDDLHLHEAKEAKHIASEMPVKTELWNVTCEMSRTAKGAIEKELPWFRDEKDLCSWGLSVGPGSFTDTGKLFQTRRLTHVKAQNRVSWSGVKEIEEQC